MNLAHLRLRCLHWLRLAPPNETIGLPDGAWENNEVPPEINVGARIDAWLEQQKVEGWKFTFSGEYWVLQRPLFYRVPILRLIRWHWFNLCRVVLMMPSGIYRIESFDCSGLAWPESRWWIVKRKWQHPLQLPSVPHRSGSFLTPLSMIRNEVSYQNPELLEHIRSFVYKNLVRNSTWALVPYVARVDIEELYDRWIQEHPSPDEIDVFKLAHLICVHGGTVKGQYIIGVLWKEDAEWYAGVVGPLLKWGLLFLGGGVAVAALILSALRAAGIIP